MIPQTIDQLQYENEQQIAAARAAEEAAREFVRAANGNHGHVLPGPALYDVLAAFKLALYDFEQVAEFLPRGLKNSLTDPRITVVESDLFDSGDERDPATQAEIASAHLNHMRSALASAAEHAEKAHAAISRQGYTPNEEAKG